MRDGDAFAKRFGGPSGDDPDFFRLTIQGFDAANASTGSVDFFLADYRFENAALDTIVGGFTTLDLSTLGTLRALEFTLSSSDGGPFGMNTPAFFAIDDVVAVPEPGSALAAGVGLIALGAWCGGANESGCGLARVGKEAMQLLRRRPCARVAAPAAGLVLALLTALPLAARGEESELPSATLTRDVPPVMVRELRPEDLPDDPSPSRP